MKIWDTILGIILLLFLLSGLGYLIFSMAIITYELGIVKHILDIHKPVYATISSSGITVTIGLTYKYVREWRKNRINKDYVIRSIVLKMNQMIYNKNDNDIDTFYEKEIKLSINLNNKPIYREVVNFYNAAKNGNYDDMKEIKNGLENNYLKL